jgi:hypothetical protein
LCGKASGFFDGHEGTVFQKDARWVGRDGHGVGLDHGAGRTASGEANGRSRKMGVAGALGFP